MSFTNSQITQENGRLVINTRNYGNRGEGCVRVAFWLIGPLLILGAGGYMGLQVYRGEWVFSNLLIASLLLCFGLLAILTVTTQRPRKTNATVTLDAGEEVLLYQQDGMDQAYMIGLGSASHLVLTHVRRRNSSGNSASSGSNTSYTDVYAITLMLKDGTQFWLYEVTNKKERAIAAAQEVQQYLCLTLEDPQDVGATAEATRSYTRQEETHNFASSSHLRIQTVQGGKEYTFHKRPAPASRIAGFLVAYFFLGIPAYIVTQAVGEISTSLAWILVPFLLLFLTIVALVFLVQARQYRLIAYKEKLEVQVTFKNALLQNRLGRTFVLTAEEIQAVRLNRLQQGNFWLSLSLSSGASLNLSSSLLVNMGAFSKNSRLTTEDRYTTLGLWEISLSASPTREPYLGDLLVVKDALEVRYVAK
ncbi:MAG: hypothetical protein AAFQ98_08420 [Bacteroidota bacterium]